MRTTLVTLAAAAAALSLSIGPVAAQSTSSIVDVASSSEDFSTLVAAVTAADLADTLSDCSAGPFTVFAPTNAAFTEALTALGISAEALLADTDTLTNILLYHVVSGKVLAADVVNLTSATTLQGSDIAIAVAGGEVKLNTDTTVTTTDLEACNGVVHVIDKVLLPPAAEEVVTISLPETGTSSSAMTLIALGTLAGGVLVLVAVRRRIST